MSTCTYTVTFYREVEDQDELDVDTVETPSSVSAEDVRSGDRDSLETVIEQARSAKGLDDEWVASQITWNGELTIIPDNM